MSCTSHFYKGLIAGLFSGIAAGVILAGCGMLCWERYLRRTVGRSTVVTDKRQLRGGSQPLSDDETWSAAPA